MRALLASPLGFLVGVSLGALGAGGSILAVPVLVYVAGQTAARATATSLLMVGTAALVGMGAHHRAGRVRISTGVTFGLAGIGGSIAGSALNRHLDAQLLLLGFSMLLLVAAWRMVVGCPTCTQVGEQEALAKLPAPAGGVSLRTRIDVAMAARVMAAGTAIGFLTGLFGVGGGFVVVPALTLLLGLPMPAAIGTSLLVIAINSATALATRVATSGVEWAVALPFTLAATAGVLTGRAIGEHVDPRSSLRWFAALLVGVAAYTTIRAATSLAHG